MSDVSPAAQPGQSAKDEFPKWGNEMPVVSEEGMSSNFYWIYGKEQRVSIQTTVRGNHTDEEIKMHIGSVIRSVLCVVGIGGTLKVIGPDTVSTVSVPAEPTPEQLPELPGLPEPVEPEAPTDPGVFTFKAVQMRVTPVEGKKAKLEFFGDDRKQPVNDFPTMICTLSIDRAIEALAPTGGWTAQHLSVAKTYNVVFLVDWKEGREYKPGKHYKDLASIRKGA